MSLQLKRQKHSEELQVLFCSETTKTRDNKQIMGNDILLEFEERWRTQMGAWLPDEGKVILRGKEIFRDLKDFSWMAVLLYSITGRNFDDKSLKLFEAIWLIGTSYPDPRLWPNRIGALAATVRSTHGLGMGAAVAGCEAIIYGHRTNIRAIDFLLRTQKKLDDGANLDEWIKLEMKKYRGMVGYGRPFVPKDERIKVLLDIAQHLEFGEGNYVRLAFQIEEALIKGRWRRYMNISGLIAALTADQGFSPREHYYYMTLCFTAGIVPCFIDVMDKPEGSFFPLRCSHVQYEGQTQRRKWNDV